MAFDFKKELKEFYLPSNKPEIVTVPKANFLVVEGKGNPNEIDGEYQKAMQLLYGIAFTLKMSYKTDYKIEGYFEYVVPPLEGLWWIGDYKEFDYTDKDKLNWISMIRLPDFIRESDFNWAVNEATHKKKQDFSKVKLFSYDEGLCVQCMHIGSYNDEPKTIAALKKHAQENNYAVNTDGTRYHHEIYLSDPRKAKPEQLKTVIRLPIK